MPEHVNPLSDDFEWVNAWAVATKPAAKAVGAAPSVTKTDRTPAVLFPPTPPAHQGAAATLVPEAVLLEQDIAEIERARDDLAQPPAFTIDARKLRHSRLSALRSSGWRRSWWAAWWV